MNRSTVTMFSTELREQGGRVLMSHPDLKHAWGARGELTFPAASADGFDVIVEPGHDEITVYTSIGMHEHFEGLPAEAIRSALRLTRDLLSPDMRVREYLAGAHSYKWSLERLRDKKWVVESQMGSFIWNFFARRTERVYQNHQLPSRLAAEAGATTSESAKD